MTNPEAFDKATKLAMKGDLALYDEILHPDYESMNQRVRINREMSKSILSENGPLFTVGPVQKIYENEEFVCIHHFSRIANKDVFYEVLTAITYENRKVITQQMVRQELDHDPSKGQDWNWEDYELPTIGLEIIRCENDQSRCI